MRKRGGEYRVIVAHDRGGVCKYVLPRELILASGIIGLVLTISFILSGLHYFHMWKTTADYRGLRVEADNLLRENEKFRVIAKQTSDQLATLEITAEKLKILSGLDQEGLGGRGGPSDSVNPVLNLSHENLYKHFKSLDSKSIDLLTKLRQLQDYYSTRSLLLAATPSLMPVNGYPSAGYGYRSDPITGQRDFHQGIDISAPYGNKVVAAADGLATFAGRLYSYGNMVRLQHKFGLSTRYGHLARIIVKAGQRVMKGDIIGYVGSSGRTTGPHLHYEVRLGRRALNPLRFFGNVD